MMNFHINSNGDVRKCKARSADSCPYDSSHHSSNETHARNFAEFLMDAEHGELSEKLEKYPQRLRQMEKRVEWTNRLREALKANMEKSPPSINKKHSPIKDMNDDLISYNLSYSDLRHSLTNEEQDTLQSYVGAGYESINHRLRDPEGYEAHVRSFKGYSDEDKERILKNTESRIQQLDKIFEKSPRWGSDRTLYRRVSQDLEYSVPAEEFLDHLGVAEGEEIEFPSYSSTSFDPGYISQSVGKTSENLDVVFVIEGGKGIPVSETALTKDSVMSVQDSEREVLLERGSRFKVQKIVRDEFELEEKQDGSSSISPVTVYLKAVE